MKQCPQCDRTYADETISFCLADGQLLSAAYDPAATLPLNPVRITDATRTKVVPVSLSPERARKRIRAFWIAAVIVAAAGFVLFQILFATIPGNDKPGLMGRLAAGALGGLMYGYVGWSACWGVPAVWRWWRGVTGPILQSLANRFQINWLLVLVVLVLLGPAITLISLYFYIPLLGGLGYGLLGGGIYEFVKAGKIAARMVHE